MNPCNVAEFIHLECAGTDLCLPQMMQCIVQFHITFEGKGQGSDAGAPKELPVEIAASANGIKKEQYYLYVQVYVDCEQ